MNKTLFLVSLIVLTLLGCAGPSYKTIEVSDLEIKYVKVPIELIEPCVPQEPLPKATYMDLTVYRREQYLTEYTVSLLGTVRDCNLKLKKISELNDKH